ncbi:unnamed protein product [Rotaria socialis]|nr:unnamed protein product [Rotaria socialis]
MLELCKIQFAHLDRFTSNIHLFNRSPNQSNALSSQDVQQTFKDSMNNQIIYCEDYFEENQKEAWQYSVKKNTEATYYNSCLYHDYTCPTINSMAGVAKLCDGNILTKSNKIVNLTDKTYKRKIIGLYFSAHWCGPCRNFTPLLSELYQEFHKEKNVEIIFISHDHDEKSFHDYYMSMPWLALNFKDRKKKEELAKKLHVKQIPKLVLLDGDSGEVICTNAVDQILYLDPEGNNFPWRSRH